MSRPHRLSPLGPDWKTWPIEAQVLWLEHLRALDKPGERFRERYLNDPVGFARECVEWPEGGGLTPYQEEILAALVTERRANVCRAAVRGPHTLGKTCVASIAILWFALTRDDLPDKSDWKIITTASVSRQLTDFLWPEVRKWSTRVKWDKVGRPQFTQYELMAETLRLKTGKASSITSSEETGTEGGHADHLLYIFDEAKAIEPSRWDAAEGALMGGVGKEIIALAISTPGDPQGRFFEIHNRKPGLEDWWVRHVTIDECIAAGRATPEFVEQRRRQWGENSAVFQNRVLGNFCESTEDCVIPLAWVEAANERWLQRLKLRHHLPGCPADCHETHWNWVDGATRGLWPNWDWRSANHEEDFTCVGVDIARSDLGDKTVIARRQEDTITQLDRYSIADTMPIVGKVKGILDRHPRAYAMVDVIGIGSGPVDRLREIFPATGRSRILAFNASEGTNLKDRAKELEFSNCLTASSRVLPVGQLKRIYRSAYQGPLFQIKMSGGDNFTATPNHQVLTRNGWRSIQSLRVGDQLCNPSEGNVSSVSCIQPQVDNVPPAIGDLYSAANRLFGFERVVNHAVNFHGDVPVGDVHIVTIDSHLLSVSPRNRQHGQDLKLVRSLLGTQAFSGDGPCSQSFRKSHDGHGVRSIFPNYRVFSCPQLPLTQGQHVVDQVVRLPESAGPNSLLFEVANNRGLAIAEQLSQTYNRLALGVFSDQFFRVSNPSTTETGSFGLSPWLDAVFCQDSSNNVSIDPKTLTQRMKRVARFVPMDQIVGIETIDSCWQRESPFVYTVECSSGAYYTQNAIHRNCRSAAWWNMRELLDPAYDSQIALPPCDLLTGDLTAPKRGKDTSSGKITVESKKDIKKRLGRSTDDGDAVVMAFFPRRRQVDQPVVESYSYLEYV